MAQTGEGPGPQDSEHAAAAQQHRGSHSRTEAAAATPARDDTASHCCTVAEWAAEEAKAEWMAKVPLPDTVTRQSVQALLAGIDAAEDAMEKASEVVLGQLPALQDAHVKKAATLHAGQKEYGVQLSAEQDDALTAALAPRMEDRAADERRWQEQRSAVAGMRRAVLACMPDSPPSRGREARSVLRDVRDDAARIIGGATYVRTIAAILKRDTRAREALLDSALARVRAAVRAPERCHAPLSSGVAP